MCAEGNERHETHQTYCEARPASGRVEVESHQWIAHLRHGRRWALGLGAALARSRRASFDGPWWPVRHVRGSVSLRRKTSRSRIHQWVGDASQKRPNPGHERRTPRQASCAGRHSLHRIRTGELKVKLKCGAILAICPRARVVAKAYFWGFGPDDGGKRSPMGHRR